MTKLVEMLLTTTLPMLITFTLIIIMVTNPQFLIPTLIGLMAVFYGSWKAIQHYDQKET